MPDMFKEGLVTPVSATVTATGRSQLPPMWTRCFRKRCAAKQSRFSNTVPLQFDFQEKVSCNTAAVLLTEATAQDKDSKIGTVVTYMDDGS